MSKAVLVIDMPKNCADCPMNFDDEPVYWCCVRNKVIPPDLFKPDWCPLKEMPEILVHEPGESVCVSRYKIGWNRCINTISGNSLKD